MKKPRYIALDKLSRQKRRGEFVPLRSEDQGWIKQMRESLGMTLSKLGDACGLAPSTIAQAEQREAEGKITVETLRKTAAAMNCEFTYAFVPKSDLSLYVEKMAYEKAKRILQTADLHMSLEDQQVNVSLESRIQRLKSKLLAEGKVW